VELQLGTSEIMKVWIKNYFNNWN